MALREKLWAQFFQTASQLGNVLSINEGEQSAAETFFGSLSLWVNNLRIVGEICIVFNDQNKKIRCKLADSGMPCMLIGYPPDHAMILFNL
jgi:hypothetical protein